MNHSEMKTEQLQELYKSSKHKVRKISVQQEDAERHYRGYNTFVNQHVKAGKLLDVGCGSGWSSFMFAKLGYDTMGVDIHSDGYEAPTSTNLKFQKEDAQHLSFPSNSFDIVCTNECLEHVPNPEKALGEMVRVLKPGGHLIVVGPNLLSLGMSVKAMFRYVWKQRPLGRVLVRDKDLPFHPLGNTLPEVVYYFLRNIFLILGKKLKRTPSFKMRTPDLRPPFHADSDSCYLLNPVDLQKYFKKHPDFKIIKSGALNRPKSLEMMASGTWFCAQKAESHQKTDH